MPVLGCGAEMAKLMDVADSDVALIEDVIAERLALGVSQAVAQRQAVDEALAQLAEERSAVMKAVMEQLGKTADMFPEEFASKRTVGDSGVKISSKGETRRGANANSEGKQITATKQGVANFWKWFGDSAAADEKGRPLVLYHSTNADFDTFEPGRETINSTTFGDVETQRHGIFTSPDKKFSQEYLRKGEGQNVMQVYASIQNPIDLREGINGEDLNAIIKASDGKLAHRDFSYVDPYETWTFFDDEFGKNFTDAAKAAGFDGAVMLEAGPDGNKPATTYVAFDANQIKSATGNLGTFNPGENSIVFSNKAQTDTPAFKRWFGADSTMVNEDGSPMVLYHGTTKQGAKAIGSGAFRRSEYGAMGAAVYLGDSPEASQGYDGGAMLQVYARGKYLTNTQWTDYVNKHGWKGAEKAATEDGWSGVYDTMFENAIAVWNPSDIKSATANNGNFDPADSRIAFSNRAQTDTVPFKTWSQGAPLIKLGQKHEFKSGQSVVVEALHGTTNADLTEFKRSKANVESDFGAGFYASNTPGDVAANYANEAGPDLTNRVERLAEQIEQADDFEGDHGEAVRRARAQLSDSAPNTLKLYMRFANPVVIGGKNETMLDYAEEYNAELDEYGEPTGKLVEFVEAIRDLAPDYFVSGRDTESAIARLFESAEGEDLKASSAARIIKTDLVDAYDDNGGSASSELVRRAFEAIGFDGIIDTGVAKKFKNMDGLTTDTVHFIAFEPTQIKSATGNNGNFDANDKRIAFANKAAELYDLATSKGNANKVVELDPVPEWQSDLAKEKAGLEIAGFTHTMDMYAVRHTIEQHGDAAKEKARGQIPVTKADIERVPAIVANPDAVAFGAKNRREQDLVASMSRMDDGTVMVVEEVRTGRRALALASVRKVPAARDFDSIARTLLSNAQSDGGDKIIVVQNQVFSNKPRPAPLAEETRWQALRRMMQDQYIHVQAIQDLLAANGGTVGVNQDVYKAEERMHGRAQEKLIDFGRNLLEPLLKKAADAGVELDELSAYAYAKHAQERNAHIDTINPKLQGAGSGMDDATAQSILQMVQLSGDQAKFGELHQDLMRLTEATRQEYLRSGLISQADYDAWTDTYKNYVPLRGFENVDEEGNARPGMGSGLSIKGKETLKALGRRSRAGDIIEHIIAEHERAVLRGETNNVAKTFLNLATTNPDPRLWEVQPRKITRGFDKKRNLVVYSQALDTADSIGVKVGGQQVYVKVKDELLLRALTKGGLDKKGALHGTVVEYAGMYTNLMRNTLTRYNPLFGAINAVRDAPVGALMTYNELGAKGAALYAKYYAQALTASGRHEWGNPNMAKEMDRWLKEMRAAGGTTSGVFMRDVNEIKSDLRTAMVLAGAQPKTLREKLMSKGKPAVKAVQFIGKSLEWMGATTEDAARLAAYRAAREMGRTPAQAASIAKNLTTNFNRSGEWGSSINGLYIFFNAAVQGSARLAQALKDPKVRAVLAAGTASAAALALANASSGGDDDDGVPYWDQVPDYVKERNLVIMLPPGMELDGAETVGKKGRYIKIPVQYGINTFMVLGYQIADLARHAVDPKQGVGPAKAGINLLSSAMSTINPFGGAFDPTDPVAVGMQLLPSIGDVTLQHLAGVDGFGRPVGPAKFDDAKPDSETYNANQAGTASQRTAAWLNSVTGGNEARSGMIDVMPGTLDNAVRNLTGGTGTFFMDTFVNLPVKAWYSPEVPVTPRDVPLWRNFYGELDSATQVNRYYENSTKARREAKIAEAEEDLDVAPEYTAEQKALQDLGAVAKKYTKDMSALRKEEIEIALDEEMSGLQKRMERRKLALERAALAKEYNSEFVQTMNAAKD